VSGRSRFVAGVFEAMGAGRRSVLRGKKGWNQAEVSFGEGLQLGGSLGEAKTGSVIGCFGESHKCQ